MSADVPGSADAQYLDMSPVAEPYPLTPEDASLAEAEAQHQARETGRQVRRGALLFGGALAVTGAIYFGHDSDWNFSADLPFYPEAQHVVESVDGNLVKLAEFLTPAAVAALAGAKLGSRKYSQLAEADMASSKELANDGRNKPSLPRRLLQNYASGWVPVTAATGVALSSIMAGVGYEISEGPSRPIEALYHQVPYNGPLSLVTQDRYAQPMVESRVSRKLTKAIDAVAQERGIAATAADLFLPTIDYQGHGYTSLVIGFPQAEDSDIAFTTDQKNCENIPVEVDKSAHIPIGAHMKINGVPVEVAGHTSGMSAIGRIGVKMSREAVSLCLEKNANVPDYMMLVEADKTTTQEIVQEAEQSAGLHETAAVLTEDEFVTNSQNFWEANSKPITNVLALMGGAVALLSMGGTSLARLIRNKRNWAANMAQGVSDNQLRLTELLRATKDGVAATAIGVGASFAAPAINMLESGLHVAVDFRTIMVGSAVGLLGSIGGSLTRLIRPHRVINIDEDTR